MTSENFKKWLIVNWNVELRWKSRKMLQVLDNCTAHCHLDSLKNIQLEFLFPNTTSLAQPMGIGKNLKTTYLTRLVLQAAEFIADSWLRVLSRIPGG
jgi:hypothetical protein